MILRVYSRSVSRSLFEVRLDDRLVGSFTARGSLLEDGSPQPQCTTAPFLIHGPGRVRVDLRDLNDAERRHRKESQGHFLLVGDVEGSLAR